jgi:diacylglycerol kinase (ATP)
MLFTDRPGHAVELARQLARDGFSPVVGVGGDGTLHEIANGLVDGIEPRTMAVVPIGTGNDFARCVGLPTDLSAAAELAFAGEARLMDLGRCGDTYFVNAGGVGLDARVAVSAAAMPRLLRRGTLPYMLATLREVVVNASSELTIVLDDTRIRQRALMVAIANGRFYGGGMKICPAASRVDGLLDVCVVGELSRREVLALLPKVFSGGHVGHPAVRFYQAQSVRIEGPPGTLVQLDGDLSGEVPIDLQAVPGAIRVVTPG